MARKRGATQTPTANARSPKRSKPSNGASWRAGTAGTSGPGTSDAFVRHGEADSGTTDATAANGIKDAGVETLSGLAPPTPSRLKQKPSTAAPLASHGRDKGDRGRQRRSQQNQYHSDGRTQKVVKGKGAAEADASAVPTLDTDILQTDSNTDPGSGESVTPFSAEGATGAAAAHLDATNADQLSQLVHLSSTVQDQLRGAYHLSLMRIASSSRVEGRVTRLITHLSRIDMTDRSSRPGIVLLHADAGSANKLITVVEIAKREIDKLKATSDGRGGYWYQYTRIDGLLQELIIADKGTEGGEGRNNGVDEKRRTTIAQGDEHASKRRGGCASPATADDAADAPIIDVATGKANADVSGKPAGRTSDVLEMQGTDTRASAVDQTGRGGTRQSDSEHESGEVSDEEAFESMNQASTPAAGKQDRHKHKHKQQRPVRTVPVMTIFMSRVRIPELESTLGEQTNAPSKATKQARTLAS